MKLCNLQRWDERRCRELLRREVTTVAGYRLTGALGEQQFSLTCRCLAYLSLVWDAMRGGAKLGMSVSLEVKLVISEGSLGVGREVTQEGRVEGVSMGHKRDPFMGSSCDPFMGHRGDP